MPQVKVWNDNVHPYNEEFRDQKISIPPKGFIVMDKDEAETFQGTYAPMKKDGDGNDIPEGYKMIRIEALSAEDLAPKESPKFTCMIDGKSFDTQAELNAHMKANYSDLKPIVDEAAEEAIKTKAKKRA